MKTARTHDYSEGVFLLTRFAYFLLIVLWFLGFEINLKFYHLFHQLFWVLDLPSSGLVVQFNKNGTVGDLNLGKAGVRRSATTKGNGWGLKVNAG